MAPSKHVFQSLWTGPGLSPLEQLCITSFLEHGFPFVLYVYDEVEGLPAGCRVEDARTILGEQEVFTQRSGLFTGSRSTFSNRFRYELLHQRGGWWVDMDTVCLTSEIPEAPYVFAKASVHGYAAGILKAPRDSEFLSQAIEHTARAGQDVEFGTLGPRLVDKLVRELDLERHAWPQHKLYPLAAYEALAVLDPGQAGWVQSRVHGSTFIHLYNHMLGLANVLRDVRPPRHSYLDTLYDAYGIEFELSRRYEWSEIAAQHRYQAEFMAIGVELERMRAEVRRLEQQLERERERRSLLQRFGRRVLSQ